MEQTSNLVKLTLGDWSEDGHGCYNEYIYNVNYPVYQIRQAYKDSCERLNIRFHHINNSNDGVSEIWTGYDENTIKKKEMDILMKHGIVTDDMITESWEEEGSDNRWYPFDTDTAAEIIMRFIAHSMPDDFAYKLQKTPNITPINGWWTAELNHQFGYGLFT